MIKKSLKNFLFLLVLVLAAGGTTSADSFELVGPGNQSFEDKLVGDEQVRPGGVITVTISNNQPGYQRFFIYIADKDADGNEILIWGTAVGGDNCRPGTSCVFDVPNITTLGLTATELGIDGYAGQAGSRATVNHVTVNR